MDIDEYLKKQQEEKDKKMTEPVNAANIIRALEQATMRGPEEANKVINVIMQTMHETGQILMARAIEEGITNIEEWNEKGLTSQDSAAILGAYYAKVDHPSNDNTYLITLPNTRIWQHKQWIKDKFNIETVTSKDLMEQEKHKEALKDFERQFKQTEYATKITGEWHCECCSKQQSPQETKKDPVYTKGTKRPRQSNKPKKSKRVDRKQRSKTCHKQH